MNSRALCALRELHFMHELTALPSLRKIPSRLKREGIAVLFYFNVCRDFGRELFALDYFCFNAVFRVGRKDFIKVCGICQPGIKRVLDRYKLAVFVKIKRKMRRMCIVSCCEKISVFQIFEFFVIRKPTVKVAKRVTAYRMI